MKIRKFEEFLVRHIASPYEHPGISDVCEQIDGMCSPQTLVMLNRAVSSCLENDEIYLEIGTWLGRTAICATLGNSANAVVIDPLTYDDSRIKCPANIARYDSDGRIRLIVDKWENAIGTEKWPSVGVHFFDGDHGTLSTFNAFEQWLPFCSNECLLIADDLCMEPVRADIELFVSKYRSNIVFQYEVKFGMGQAIIGFKK